MIQIIRSAGTSLKSYSKYIPCVQKGKLNMRRAIVTEEMLRWSTIKLLEVQNTAVEKKKTHRQDGQHIKHCTRNRKHEGSSGSKPKIQREKKAEKWLPVRYGAVHHQADK